jgi:hypothetical protein
MMCDVRCGVCVVQWARTDVVPDLDAALVVLVAPLHLVLDELHIQHSLRYYHNLWDTTAPDQLAVSRLNLNVEKGTLSV